VVFIAYLRKKLLFWDGAIFRDLGGFIPFFLADLAV
jgi:hypothetical protein